MAFLKAFEEPPQRLQSQLKQKGTIENKKFLDSLLHLYWLSQATKIYTKQVP
jgi:hypothetical protein